MEYTIQDFDAANRMEMPLDGDFSLDLLDDYVPLDFNEADFADVNDQEIGYDGHGLTNSEEQEPAQQFNPLPMQQDEPQASDFLPAQPDDNAAFIAEVMAGAEMNSDFDATAGLSEIGPAFANYGSQQQPVEQWEGNLSRSDYEMPPLDQMAMPMVVNAMEQGAINDRETATTVVDSQILDPEQTGAPVDDYESSKDMDNEALKTQEGCIAPPSSPAPAEEALPGISPRPATVYHDPRAPTPSPQPAKRIEPPYQNATNPVPDIEPAIVYHRNKAQNQTDEASQTALATNYQRRFQDFDAARQALEDPDSDKRLVKLPVAVEDDWEVVKTERLHRYAAQLYDAIQAEPGEPPRNFQEHQRAYYYKQQAKVLSNIKEQIASKPAAAEARVLLALEEIINLHEKGLPEAILMRPASGSNFAVETNFICSARAGKVIKIAGNDKYVSLDILNGTNLPDLTRSPIKYLDRKRQNSKVNARKAENNRIAAQVQVVPVASPGVKLAASKELATRRMLAEGSRAATPTAMPVAPAPLARPRAGPAPRVKATLKRRNPGEVQQASTKRAKHQDVDEEMADACE